MKHYHAKPTGFTLVEMMVVVVILAILAAYAIPSFASMISEQTTQKGATDIVGAFNQARLQAALTGKNMNLVLDPSYTTYSIQFVASDGSINTMSEYVLDSRLRVTSTAPTTLTNPIVALPSGEFVGGGTFVFRICDDDFVGEDGYAVSINSNGLSRVSSSPVVDFGNDTVSNAPCG